MYLCSHTITINTIIFPELLHLFSSGQTLSSLHTPWITNGSLKIVIRSLNTHTQTYIHDMLRHIQTPCMYTPKHETHTHGFITHGHQILCTKFYFVSDIFVPCCNFSESIVCSFPSKQTQLMVHLWMHCLPSEYCY